jgi:hypothetical protein
MCTGKHGLLRSAYHCHYSIDLQGVPQLFVTKLSDSRVGGGAAGHSSVGSRSSSGGSSSGSDGQTAKQKLTAAEPAREMVIKYRSGLVTRVRVAGTCDVVFTDGGGFRDADRNPIDDEEPRVDVGRLRLVKRGARYGIIRSPTQCVTVGQSEESVSFSTLAGPVCGTIVLLFLFGSLCVLGLFFW